MPSHDLPERPSLEYLKKLAKERLRALRQTDPDARLAQAQRAVARDHGFSSWRALRAEVERRVSRSRETFAAACKSGELASLSRILEADPTLARARLPGGTTGLHLAVAHPQAVLLLLEHGADPGARDEGDNALPIHFAAGGGPLESVRALLDAGSDVQGVGDAHRLDVIGWASCFAEARRDVVTLLLERGARHHVFSAVALADQEALRNLVEEDPAALQRRLSAGEQEQTALHYVVAPPDGLVGGLFRTGEHYRTLEALIGLGAELEAVDARGRTPLAVAMLRGDVQAMRLLHDAGAREPEALEASRRESLSALAPSIAKVRPMLGVPDMEATVAWYRAIGFELTASHEEDGRMDWASVTFGGAELMFAPSTEPWRGATSSLSLWIMTDRLDELYALLKGRQLARAHASLAGQGADTPEVRFTVDLHTAFYGQREFGVRDPNGVEVMFYQPLG